MPKGVFRNPQERSRKISVSLTGRKNMKPAWNKGLTKDSDPRITGPKNPWNKGLTKETDDRIARISILRKPWNLGLKGDKRCINQGLKAWETRKKHGTDGVWNKGLTKETDLRVAINAKSIKCGYDNGRVAWFKGETKKTNPILKQAGKKASIWMTRQWKNQEYRKLQLSRLFSRRYTKPNKLETSLLNLLDSILPGVYKYTGSKPLSCGLVPDFTTVDDNKVIELFGDYWHKGENPQNRISELAKFGYKCLVIWECELKDKSKGELSRLIKNFTAN